MSASRKLRGFCINMALPLWNKWHSSHVDCRAGLATLAREHCTRMWGRKKHAAAGSCYWIYYLNIYLNQKGELLEHGIKSNLCSLHVFRWFHFFLWYLKAHFFTIEMNSTELVQCVESIFASFNMQPQIFLLLFSFLMTCTDGCCSMKFTRFGRLICFP